MKKILTTLLVAATATTMLAGCGSSATDWSYIEGNGEMVIGITYFEPMNYKDENGKLTGFETEFAEKVCEKMGVKPVFQKIDWESKEVELTSKTIDCIWNGMTITEERAANMSISNPYMTNKQVVVAKAENAEKYAASLADAVVVAEAGSAGEELAKSNTFFSDAQYTPVDSMAKALMDVAAGTSDVAVVDYVASIGSIGEGTDFADLVVVETEEFSPEEYGIAFRKGSDMTEKVNAAISELAADGTLAEIAAKYKLDEVLSAE